MPNDKDNQITLRDAYRDRILEDYEELTGIDTGGDLDDEGAERSLKRDKTTENLSGRALAKKRYIEELAKDYDAADHSSNRAHDNSYDLSR